MCRDETNDEVKLRIVAALEAWMGQLEDVLPKLVDQLSNGLKDKEALRRAHLHALLQVTFASGTVMCV